MMKSFPAVVFGLLLSVALAAAAPPPDGAPSLSQEDRALVDRINAYFNGFRTLEADFVQIAPDGSIANGSFYLKRPGRLRFEYAPPSPITVVADGTWLIVKDNELKSIDRYPLGSTPVGILVEDEVDLVEDATITGISIVGGITRISLRNPNEPERGEVTLNFSGSGEAGTLELRSWTIIDAQGLATTVALDDVEIGRYLDPRLFVVEEKDAVGPFGRNR